MSDYIYLIHPFRDGFYLQPTEEEALVMEEHFQYLEEAVESGAVILAGPCLDDTFGIVIFRAEDEEAARAFMLNDPSVKKNVMMAELHPIRLSLHSR
jgi:uncharacterized protein